MSGEERLERLLQEVEDADTPHQLELAKAKLAAYKEHAN